MFRAFPPVLFVLFIAGCTPPPPTTASRASAAALASCRASTNHSFDRQNRYLLSERSTTDTPFSTSGDPGVTTRGLTQRYDYDTQLASCLGSSDASAGVANGPATSAPPPAQGNASLSPF